MKKRLAALVLGPGLILSACADTSFTSGGIAADPAARNAANDIGFDDNAVGFDNDIIGFDNDLESGIGP